MGDFVFVEKAGEVIPAVIGVNLERRTPGVRRLQVPEEMPLLRHARGPGRGEVALRCPNYGCPVQVRRRVRHFASKGCVDIDGLGEAMVDILVEKGWVRGISGIYRLKRDDLLGLGKSVEKSTDNLLAAIERSKGAELWRFINGLGIPHVGTAAAKDLASKFAGLEALSESKYDDYIGAGKETVIAGIGKTMAEAIIDHFNQPVNRTLVHELAKAGRGAEAPAPVVPGSGPFVGEDFRPHWEPCRPSPREEASAKDRGRPAARCPQASARRLAHVLAGSDAGSKLDKAKALGGGGDWRGRSS